MNNPCCHWTLFCCCCHHIIIIIIIVLISCSTSLFIIIIAFVFDPLFQIVTVVGDMRDKSVQQQVLDKTCSTFGQVDILVNDLLSLSFGCLVVFHFCISCCCYKNICVWVDCVHCRILFVSWMREGTMSSLWKQNKNWTHSPKISPKTVNFRDIAGNAEEEEEGALTGFLKITHCFVFLLFALFMETSFDFFLIQLSSWMVHAGCVFVAGISLSRTWMSGSFESVWWNACVPRLDLSLYSHPKEFSGMEAEPMLTPREKPHLLEAQRWVKPATLHQAGQWTQHTTAELFWPCRIVLASPDDHVTCPYHFS